MAEYWGLDAIAERMHIGVSTLLRWHEFRSFLMYRRRHGPRSRWYTNDVLIQTWEIARCRQDHEAKISTKALRKRSVAP